MWIRNREMQWRNVVHIRLNISQEAMGYESRISQSSQFINGHDGIGSRLCMTLQYPWENLLAVSWWWSNSKGCRSRISRHWRAKQQKPKVKSRCFAEILKKGTRKNRWVKSNHSSTGSDRNLCLPLCVFFYILLFIDCVPMSSIACDHAYGCSEKLPNLCYSTS